MYIYIGSTNEKVLYIYTHSTRKSYYVYILYIYICIYICVCVYIYIYIYIYVLVVFGASTSAAQRLEYYGSLDSSQLMLAAAVMVQAHTQKKCSCNCTKYHSTFFFGVLWKPGQLAVKCWLPPRWFRHTKKSPNVLSIASQRRVLCIGSCILLKSAALQPLAVQSALSVLGLTPAVLEDPLFSLPSAAGLFYAYMT